MSGEGASEASSPVSPASLVTPASTRGSPRRALVRWVLVRGIGFVFLIAFVSLAVQVRALVGEHGILPAREWVELVEARLGSARFLRLPTLIWWTGASDGALLALCGAGILASGLSVAGFAPGPMLLTAWALYLSLFRAGQVFLGFQWDLLLLEAGLLAAVLAPWGLRSRLATDDEPSAPALWLVRALVFKLMFLSGFVKLASGDRSWRSLKALQVHFETQPLPTWLGWWAHQLPGSILEIACALTLAIELGGPWLILCGRVGRRIACASFVALMAVIAATGNYTFFNVLTVVLCLGLLDDQDLARMVPARWRGRVPSVDPPREREPWHRWPRWTCVAVLGLANAGLLLGRLLGPAAVIFDPVSRMLAPLDSVNGYGLFAVMTQTRPEIVIEGSDDGVAWKEYELWWKPGALDRRPRFVAPHQPRLDWQLWFAALDPRGDRYLVKRLLERVKEGTPEVLALFRSNPFPDHPPAHLRAVMFDYRFTDWAALRTSGQWWRREPIGLLITM